MTNESGCVVRIERTFDAPAEEVFDAWTSPEVMRRWLHCGPDWETPLADVDLRVGGQVRVVMRRPNGTEARAQGEYTLIDRPRRLVMTWTFDDDPANEQLIELSFSESSEGSTAVLMVNSRISTDARRDAQEEGWQGCLNELERLFVG
ncbi:MAG: SRPBCC domain-containing protein [Solirubrobacterales bacterium]|nr:SRPBCC domain-containing protein [Solirubrobacterales bacterium]MBV9050393.1 SRPBCC domain-containing protein [Solirubrobacterales bacterium]